MNENKVEKFTIYLNVLEKYTSVGDFKDGVLSHIHSVQFTRIFRTSLPNVFSVKVIFTGNIKHIIRILNLEGEVLYELDSSNDTACYVLLGLFRLLNGKTD